MRIAVVVSALVLAISPAFADPPGMTPALEPLPAPAPLPSQTPLVQSYWGQTAASDGLALALTLGAASMHNVNNSDALAKLALGTYLFGAPVIHLLHDRSGRAFGSLALRASVPIIVAELVASSTGADDDDNLGAILLGAFAGAIGVAVIDSAFLAKGDDPPPRTWAPVVAPTTQGGMTFGVGGAF